jgi:hypothetical protein
MIGIYRALTRAHRICLGVKFRVLICWLTPLSLAVTHPWPSEHGLGPDVYLSFTPPGVLLWLAVWVFQVRLTSQYETRWVRITEDTEWRWIATYEVIWQKPGRFLLSLSPHKQQKQPGPLDVCLHQALDYIRKARRKQACWTLNSLVIHSCWVWLAMGWYTADWFRGCIGLGRLGQLGPGQGQIRVRYTKRGESL